MERNPDARDAMADLIEPGAIEHRPDHDGQIRLSQAISLKRIADSLERIGECADGIHPSAFRVVQQAS